MNTPLERRLLPEVEGLRAIAVISVLLFHARLGFSGGFVGVDVFFVVSGFLITGLLVRELESTGTVHLREFYARRVRRLLPVATLVLVAVVLDATPRRRRPLAPGRRTSAAHLFRPLLLRIHR